MLKALILVLILLFQLGTAQGKENEIFSFKVLKQTQDSVLFEISYYYSGDHGDKAKLTAWLTLILGLHSTKLTALRSVLLRACGTIRLMSPYRLFFSHGGDDTFIVNEFLKPKVESSGANVFLDAGRLDYGDDFRETIFVELAQADELLVLLTPSAIRRPWVIAEIGAMLVRGKGS